MLCERSQQLTPAKREVGHTGRYVAPKYITGSTTNEESFEAMRDLMDHWDVYDNMVGKGEPPKFRASKSGRPHEPTGRDGC